MQNSDYGGDERRKHQRILFSIENNVTGQFLFSKDGSKHITAYILNISLGGLHLSPSNGKDLDVKKGDRMVFIHLTVPDSEPLILNIDTEVRWIVNPDMLEYMSIGCSFFDLSDSKRQRLESYLRSYR